MSTVEAPPDGSKRKRTTKARIILYGSLIFAVVVLIAMVSVLTGGNVTSGENQFQSSYTGKLIPNFTLDSVRGGVVHAPWEKQRPAVVFFFASWCPPCRGEIPKIASYINAHHLGGGRVLLIGVDGDTSKTSALDFMNKDHVNFPVGFDPSDSVIFNDFAFNGYPDTAFVTAKGVIQQVHFGAITPKELSLGIKQLMDTTT